MNRKRHESGIVKTARARDNTAMDKYLDALRAIGIPGTTLAALAAGEPTTARAYALLLLAHYDDRHEYVD